MCTSVGIGCGNNLIRSKDQCELPGEFSALCITESGDIFFDGRHDRRPVIAMTRDRFSHPTVQQTDERGRRHAEMFKFEEQFKIKSPS